jgi:hypothetical protein
VLRQNPEDRLHDALRINIGIVPEGRRDVGEEVLLVALFDGLAVGCQPS